LRFENYLQTNSEALKEQVFFADRIVGKPLFVKLTFKRRAIAPLWKFHFDVFRSVTSPIWLVCLAPNLWARSERLWNSCCGIQEELAAIFQDLNIYVPVRKKGVLSFRRVG